MAHENAKINSVAVVIVNFRTAELAMESARAVEGATPAFGSFRIIIVDGASEDGSNQAIAASIAGGDCPGELLALSVNGGFAFANNQAFAALARMGPLPDAIVLINPDARAQSGALESMAAVLEREPRAGAVGAQLVHSDGRRQASAFTFPSIRGEFCRGARTRLFERLLCVPASTIDVEVTCEVPWVTGAAVMLRTAALRQSGLFDEGFFLYFEETDLMRRMRRRGWTIWHEPAAKVFHAGGVATNIRDPELGTPRGRRMPPYWYNARRRYFALANGRAAAMAASTAWILGDLWWRIRQMIAPRVDNGALRGVRDLLEFGFWPRPVDAEPRWPKLGDPANRRPAWMDWER